MGSFDVVTLMAALQGTEMESLNEDFISKKLLPWQEGTPRSVVKRLHGVWQTLDRYAIVTAVKAAFVKKGLKRQPAGAERGETMPKRGRGGSRPGSSRAEAQKRNPAQSRDSGEGHSEAKQAKWPREDGRRGSSSLWCDNRADWDLQVGPTRGGLREICQHSEGILAKPQGVLPV